MFIFETDASDFAISLTLNEDWCPIALHSCTLQASELYHSSVEKAHNSRIRSPLQALSSWSSTMEYYIHGEDT